MRKFSFIVLFFSLLWVNGFTMSSEAKDATFIASQNGVFVNNEKVLDIPTTHILSTLNGIFALTSKGIYFTTDFQNWEERNNGLDFSDLLVFNENKNKFELEDYLSPLLDIKVDPYNSDNLVTLNQHGVFVSTNAGKNWSFIKNPLGLVGARTVAIYSENSHLYVLLGLSTKGVYRLDYHKKYPKWISFSSGMRYVYDSLDEIADLLVIKDIGETRIFALTSFNPQIYEYNFSSYKWDLLYASEKETSFASSLFYRGGSLYFLEENSILKYNTILEEVSTIRNNLALKRDVLSTKNIEQVIEMIDGHIKYSFKDLWQIKATKKYENQSQEVFKQKGMYIATHNAINKQKFEDSLDVVKEGKLDTIVFDLKDDQGYIRYDTKNKKILHYAGRGSHIDWDTFIPFAKKHHIYLIARMVIFKDPFLYKRDNFRLAIKDKNGNPWQGLHKDGSLIDEYWVDPYSHDVWEYNVAIAKELEKLGFDEIQFDYIRFPTDGTNIMDTNFTYQQGKLTKETALLSFLKYAKSQLNVPISVDLYGYNSWHRIGGITGQYVPLISNYVNYISPMYYPSHFTQNFLDFAPREKRPYRIYSYGSMRTFFIGRGNIKVRPWVQAFYLNVSYDREFYGKDYINEELQGANNGRAQGVLFWTGHPHYKTLKEALDIYLKSK